MKKIPTLFEREFENHRIVRILPNVSPDLAWVMADEGVATIKWDGACCAVINGVFYKRYDAKHGKPIPSNAIKCQEKADPVTGHLPCWVPCNRAASSDKWFWDAYDKMGIVPDGTYEAIGPHFRSNPHNLDTDILKPHGKDIVELDRSFEGIRTYLETHVIEGIVFWKDGQPWCKIKRTDFGLPWGRCGRWNRIFPRLSVTVRFPAAAWISPLSTQTSSQKSCCSPGNTKSLIYSK